MVRPWGALAGALSELWRSGDELWKAGGWGWGGGGGLLEGTVGCKESPAGWCLGLRGGFGRPGLVPLPVSKGGIPFPQTLRMPAFPGHRAGFLEAGGGRERSWAAPAVRVFAQGEGGA